MCKFHGHGMGIKEIAKVSFYMTNVNITDADQRP